MPRKNFWRAIGILLLIGVTTLTPHTVIEAKADDPLGDVLGVVLPSTSNGLFVGVFNPSPAGLSDVYTVRIWYFLHDPAYVVGPDARYHNYRCQLVDVKYNVQIPDDAVVWNGTRKAWVNSYAGKTARSAITWKCGLGQWNDGQPITLADFMFDLAMNFEWAFQDGGYDRYYDQHWADNMRGVLDQLWGIKVNGLTDDYIEYTVYQDYAVPYDNWGTAVGNYVEYPALPWELYNVLSEAVANGVGGKSFSWSTQPPNGFQLDMMSPEQAPYFKEKAEDILRSENLIPVELSTLDRWLMSWGITPSQAGITEDLAKEGYKKIIQWAEDYKNVLISSGPYYVAKYNPQEPTLLLKLANNDRIGFATDEINGVPIPWEPHWEEVYIYGTTNAQTAILAVAKGDYDFYWLALPYSDLKEVVSEYRGSTELVKTISEWWSLGLNLVGDSHTGLVNTSNGVSFNPFALREVRYAMNWLISRDYIVSNILQGGGAPLYGPEVSGQVDAAARIDIVRKALGFTGQGNEQYAIKMIDLAMNNASKALAAKGHKLEKKDGKWYFDGEPVTVKVIARVEDQRLDEGKYVAQVLQKAGFDVQVLQWSRTQASKVVYSSDPSTMQWHVYTEGWLVGGIQPPSSIAWDFWILDYYVDPNWGTAYKNPITVRDLIYRVSNGDLSGFISNLGLRYYRTPSSLQPLLDWTGYDLAMLLAYNNWTAHGTTVSIHNLDQFWDLYELAYGTHALNSPRVYTAETWNFFVMNKQRIKVTMPDPISGLGSFLAARSVEPVYQNAGGTAAGGSPTDSSTTSTPAATTTSTVSSPSGTSGDGTEMTSSGTTSTYMTSTNTSSSAGHPGGTSKTPMGAAQSESSVPVTYLALGGVILIGLVGIAAVKMRGKSTKPSGSPGGNGSPTATASSINGGGSSSTVTSSEGGVPGFPSELYEKYEPLEFLGEGGFARVFKVKRRKDGTIVALKIPRIDKKTSKTFIREVSTWLQLDHPNIVKLYDVDILPIPHLEIEFVEGTEINGELVRNLDEYPKPVDENTSLNLIKGIAEGLRHAHSKGIVHRDLKPLNVLLTSDLIPKITDWGLSKFGTMSSTRSVMGYTPLYAAPEQLMPSKYGHTDARTDIWQLGVTFYELLTGRLPFEGYTYDEVFGKIVDESFKFKLPSEFDSRLAKYDEIFKKLLARRKEERYQTIEELLGDLEKLTETERRKVELEKRVEELKRSLRKSIDDLKKSTNAEEIIRNRRLVVETLGNLALAYAELNRKAELLNTLNDLKFYTIKNLADITDAIDIVRLMISEGMPVSQDFIERLKVLIHNIKRENEL